MPQFVTLDDVWKMLDHCLPGHERKPSSEYWTIKYKGRSYRRIPVGPHGRKDHVSVMSRHIRSMVRFFEIDACADSIIDIR
jgi:hypothetical protein